MTDLTKNEVLGQIERANKVIYRLRLEAKERNAMAAELARNNSLLKRHLKRDGELN